MILGENELVPGLFVVKTVAVVEVVVRMGRLAVVERGRLLLELVVEGVRLSLEVSVAATSGRTWSTTEGVTLTDSAKSNC